MSIIGLKGSWRWFKTGCQTGKGPGRCQVPAQKIQGRSPKLRAEAEGLKQQLGNSQEEAANIYSEWLKAQKDSKEAKDRIERLEEQKRELEMQIKSLKNYNRIPGQKRLP